MADFVDHIEQAEHNEALGELLSTSPALHKYRDWLITVSFYAAIHYVEADFATDRNIGHSETSKPPDITPHDHREDLVRKRYGQNCWKSYKKLREASRDVRYLTRAISKRQPGKATDYYSQSDAENFFRHHLKIIKEATQ